MSDNSGGDARPKKTDGAALIVGGSGALGSAIARRLAQDYASVFFTYHANAEGARALAADLGHTARAGCAALDVRDGAAVAALVEDVAARFGPLEAVVFASGVNIEQPFISQITAAQWREVVESELLGFSHVVAAALPAFRGQQRGVFINIGTFGNYAYPPGDALSTVPKAGTEALCHALAREEGRHGIRANVVAPGIIAAGIGAKLMQNTLSPPVWEQQRQRVPLRAFGQPGDVAEAVAFLASARARYITGVTLLVDGGLHL